MVIWEACQLVMHPPSLHVLLQSLHKIPLEVLCRLLISNHLSISFLVSQWVSRLWGRGPGAVRHLHCFTCTHVLVIKYPFRANEDDCIELMLKAFSSDEMPHSLLQGKLNNYCNWMTYYFNDLQTCPDCLYQRCAPVHILWPLLLLASRLSP